MPDRNFHAKLQRMRGFALVALLAFVGCTRAAAPVDAGPPALQSEQILNRPVQTTHAVVRHILIGWGDLAPYYRTVRMDPRARARDQASAEELVRSILKRLQDGEDFSKLEAQFSEDAISAQYNSTFDVRSDAQFEPEFQALALRLKVNEIGVCRTAYGYHVMQRVK